MHDNLLPHRPPSANHLTSNKDLIVCIWPSHGADSGWRATLKNLRTGDLWHLNTPRSLIDTLRTELVTDPS